MQNRVLVLGLAMIFVGCGGGNEESDGGDPIGLDANVEVDANVEIDAGPTCSDTLCDDGCVDLNTDPMHCGSCAMACNAGEVCSTGSCEIACPGAQGVCDGGCYDLQTSPVHCGDCASSCSAGEVCSGGTCALSCGGMTPDLCGSSCVDFQTHGAFCGDCDTACSAGEVCSGGTCALSCGGATPDLCGSSCVDFQTNGAFCGDCTTACSAGEVCSGGTCGLSCGGMTPDLCGSSCVDFQTSPRFCGDCDTACSAGEVCSGGTCGLSCGGATPDLCGSSCVDLQTSARFCGDCATTCASGGVCTAGSCACPSGMTDCGGVCVDTASDPNHCGACDDAGSAVCPERASATAVCGAGRCGFVCNAGREDCNGVAADGCEVTLSSDPLNCGACGAGCGGNPCAGGACNRRVAYLFGTMCRPYRSPRMLWSVGCVNINRSTTWFDGQGLESIFFAQPDCGGPFVQASTRRETNLCTARFSNDVTTRDNVESIWLGHVFSSCAQILEEVPSSLNGSYPIDIDGPGPEGVRVVYCDMARGGWTLGFLKNSAHSGYYGDFGATETNLEVLDGSPIGAAASSTPIAGWLNLNTFPYTHLRIESVASGTSRYLSGFIARTELRINFGDDGYLLGLPGGPGGNYIWCAGQGTFTDGGIGQVRPYGSTTGCKGHAGLGSGWDFSESLTHNQGLTMTGIDGAGWMHANYGGGEVNYGSPGAAYAIWVR